MLDGPQSLEAFEDDTKDVVAPYQSKFGAVWFHEIGRKKPSRSWVIKNLIPAKSFGIVYGPPGCGKSFLVIDMMLTCSYAALSESQRADWFGYKASAFGVVYVVAEGSEDFEVRLHAWRAEHGIATDVVLPFVFLPTSIDMRSSDADTKKLAEEISAINRMMQKRCGVTVGVTVIDTVARSLAGGNENDSQVMGAFVINCGKLESLTGATTLGVHHGGKEGGRGPRGHEALHGAADFEIEVTGATKDDPNIWTVRKLKSGPGGAAHKFRLRQVFVDNDEEGDQITSCVCEHLTARQVLERQEAAQGLPLKGPAVPIFRALMLAIKEKGIVPTPEMIAAGVPADLMAVHFRDWRDAYKAVGAPGNDGEAPSDDAIRKMFERYVVKQSYVANKIIGYSRPYVWWRGVQIKGFPETVPKIAGHEPDKSRTQGFGEGGDEMAEYGEFFGENAYEH